jgi:uncharacterized protein YbbK (DUF523 family)/uncharacterized protein YbgA (DUF1722 family)
MKPFTKPRVFFSRCLGFEACRYDGAVIHDEFADALASRCVAQSACPECLMGLGVPREPLRALRGGEGLGLFQPATGRDCTEGLRAVAAREVALLAAKGGIDGALLKARSPSCGPRDVRIYATREAKTAPDRGAGLFATTLAATFPDLPIEDEERTRNFALRESFLIALYCRAEFRSAIEGTRDFDPLDPRALLALHTRYKLLFMAYSPTKTRVLGGILAKNGQLSAEEIFATYGHELALLFARPFKSGSMINALQHAFGGLSAGLAPEGRRFFLGLLEEYRDERIPLSAVLRVLTGWAIMQENEYLLEQRLLSPYPLELIAMGDSGKGRDYEPGVQE